jgi:hypothetical protein
MRVVIFNAHFGPWANSTVTMRADKCVRMLRRMKSAASTVIMIQEAGQYLVALCRTQLKTHMAHAMPNRRYGLLTLVPHAMHETEGARVQMYDLAGQMGREFHVLYVGTLALVNTHLESCAQNSEVRRAQYAAILAKRAKRRLVIFGDLNGLRIGNQSLWDTFISDGDVTVAKVKTRAFYDISSHKRHTFEVA